MEVRVPSSALFVNRVQAKNLQQISVHPTVHRHAKYLPISRDFMPFFPEGSPFFSAGIRGPFSQAAVKSNRS